MNNPPVVKNPNSQVHPKVKRDIYLFPSKAVRIQGGSVFHYENWEKHYPEGTYKFFWSNFEHISP